MADGVYIDKFDIAGGPEDEDAEPTNVEQPGE